MITEQGYARLRGVLRRRRLAVVGVAVCTLAVSAVVISRLEPHYKATAVVRALESQPPRELAPTAVVEQVGERLKTLRLAATSRLVLGKVVDELHLAHDAAQREKWIERIRTNMEVKVEGEDTFVLAYEDTDAVRASEIVNHTAADFMAAQVKYRETVTSATAAALTSEVKALQPIVEKLRGDVRDFKLAHYGSLPEQQEQNLRMLDETTMELNIQSSNLDLDQEHRRELIASAMSPMRHQEAQLADELNDVRTKYTPEHPEVHRVEAEFERVHAQRLEEEKLIRQKMKSSNPELMALDGDIRRTQAYVETLKQRLADVRARVADTAKNGQALARLQADLEQATTKYEAVQSRQREAELAARVEANLAGERFSLVEGAVPPSAPVKPDRPLLGLLALLLAGGLALGVGFALDRADSRIYAPQELGTLGRPLELLACIPDLDERTAA